MRLFRDDDLARLRARATEPSHQPAWKALRKAADAAPASPLRPPVEGSGWTHEYFCPTHGTRLIFDQEQPHAHRCRTDGASFSGEPYDGAWRAIANGRIVDGLLACALVWTASGTGSGTGSGTSSGADALLSHVTGTLGEYADRYPDYPVHGEHAGKGRCMGQSLDEATWGIPLASAYDLVRDALEPGTRARLEADLIRPLGEHLRGQLWHGIHNIECWHLGALATVGAVLDEPAFLEPGRAEEAGLPGQLREGVLEDGWWYEGSASYHFYTIRALLPLVRALRGTDPGVIDQPRLRAMFAAPLELARADLTLPALNDGWISVTTPPGIGEYAPVYEQGWDLWQDPDHARVLRAVYDRGTRRSSPEALLFGPDLDRTDGTRPRGASRVFDPSGYAVLRTSGGESEGDGTGERWALLKYGGHGGGHGHPDKLGIELHAFGERLAPDLGTVGYGVPLHQPWFRHTLAHNTIVVGKERQPAEAGTLARFDAPDEQGGVGVAEAVVRWPDDRKAGAYRGVTARRCLLMTQGDAPYLLDVVLVEAPRPRPIELAWHHLGELRSPDPAGLATAAWDPADESYALLADARAVPGPEWSADWRVGKAPTGLTPEGEDSDAVGTRMWGLDPAGATTIAARAPSNPPSDSMAFLLRGVTARRAVFVSILEPVRGRGSITGVDWEPAGGSLAVAVRGTAGTDVWTLDHGSVAVGDAGAVLPWTRENRPERGAGELS